MTMGEFYSASDTQEACALLSRYGEKASVLAGGTDLMVAVNQRRMPLETVEGIVTHKDVPNNAFGLVPDQPVLAETIRYRGQPIAAVAAHDERAALKAIDQIKVEVDEEEPVFDPQEAMKPGAPKVRPEGNCYMYGEHPCRKVVFGDVEAGFKEADHIIEGEFRTNPVEHAPMETQVSLAVPEGSGGQALFHVQRALLHPKRLCGGVLRLHEQDPLQLHARVRRLSGNLCL
jgi:CO/xanthine dehydrogenase Mo-binding subunit